jgi:hypothetical protein
MSFRYRNIVSLGKFARINLSKSGASLSVGPRGATVNFSPKYGVTGTVGIPSTGMSWRTKLFGSRRYQAKPGTPLGDVVEQLKEHEATLEWAAAKLKVFEAEYAAQELAVWEAREACQTSAQAAELKIMEAKLALNKTDLDFARNEYVLAEKRIEDGRRKLQLFEDRRTISFLICVVVWAIVSRLDGSAYDFRAPVTRSSEGAK